MQYLLLSTWPAKPAAVFLQQKSRVYRVDTALMYLSELYSIPVKCSNTSWVTILLATLHNEQQNCMWLELYARWMDGIVCFFAENDHGNYSFWKELYVTVAQQKLWTNCWLVVVCTVEKSSDNVHSTLTLPIQITGSGCDTERQLNSHWKSAAAFTLLRT